MKRSIILLSVLISVIVLGFTAPVQAALDQESGFPEGVIVVPKGTQVNVNPDESITITDCPVTIEAGDTFVVYLEDLPLGYVAETVDEADGQLTITGPHADPGIYDGMNLSGKIELTEDRFEFVTARALASGDLGISVLDTFKYKDGALTVRVGDVMSKVAVTFSEMEMNLSTYGMSSQGGISGNWKVEFISSSFGGGLSDQEISLG